VAILLAEMPDSAVSLIESNSKKAAFLRHVVAMLDLPARVHNERIERVVPTFKDIDIVTARALAPLDELIGLSSSLLKSGAIGLFLKGRDVERELTEAAQSWQFRYRLHTSVTAPDAAIVEVFDLR
jgi:16S rRNA (guanine527-N7)-methyltransferase